MTISAINPSNNEVFGYYETSIPDINILEYTNVSADVLTDLDTITPTGAVSWLWRIAWSLYIEAPNIQGNPSKFLSALPRLNYGVIDFVSEGFEVTQEFWNYSNQRYLPRLCWAQSSSQAYPQSFSPPNEFVDNAELNPLSTANLDTSILYGDGFYLVNFIAQTSSAKKTVYWQANAFPYVGNASFGFI